MVDFGAPYRGEPAEIRPALVIGPSDLETKAVTSVFLVPLTSRPRPMATTRVEIDDSPDTGLDEPSYAQLEQTRAVAPDRLLHRIGVVGEEVLHPVRMILRALLGL